MANFSFSGAYSSSADGWKCNGSSTATGTCSALFSNSYTIDSLSIYFSGYRSSGSGTSSTDSPGLLWTLTGSNGGSASGNIMLRFSTSQQLSYTNATISNISGQFSGKLTLKVSDPNDTITSCNLYVQDAAIYGTSANVTSYIYYYNGSSLHYRDDTNSGPVDDKFTYYLASAPSKTGYTFKGWGTSLSASTTYSAGASRTGYYGTNYEWYANWTANTYTITYEYAGGSGSSTTKFVTYNNTYGTLPIPTKTGYIFDGWYTSASGGVIITSTTIVTTARDHTLYARWTPKKYPVLYNGNGGFHSSGEKTWKDEINTFTFNKEEPVSLEDIGNKDFKKVGYELLGWNSFFAAKLPLKTYTIVEDKEPELFAIWKAKSNIWVYQNGKWRLSLPYIYHNGKWYFCLYKIHKDLFVEVLEDFDYIIPFNSSTATITDWKETYQGESSNELIIPNNPKIIL